MVYLGADHRGYELKERLKEHLAKAGVVFEDLGAHELNPNDDYVDFGAAVAQAVAQKPNEHRGVLICHSGIGMDIVANKIKGIRAASVGSEAVAAETRRDNDSNVLILSGELMPAHAALIAETWLKTAFSGEERHARRIKKIADLEAQA